MPNLTSILKSEISRLARKELKGDVDTLRKSVASYRSEIAALKRRIEQVEKSTSRLAKATPKAASSEASDSSTKLRFRADGFKSKREALELTAEQAGKFFSVSGQTIYLWESKKTAPRASQMPAIAAFRKLSRRQASQILESFA